MRYEVVQAFFDPMKRMYTDVSGSPFFTEEFRPANILFLVAKKYRVSIHVWIFAARSSVSWSVGKKCMCRPAWLKRCFYRYVAETGNTAFSDRASGCIPPKPNRFYEVLSDGHCRLLKLLEKTIVQRKNDLSGEVTNEFESYEEYYAFSGKEMKRIKRDHDFILSLLIDKKEQADTFLRTNKINLRNASQMIRVIDFYNQAPGAIH